MRILDRFCYFSHRACLSSHRLVLRALWERRMHSRNTDWLGWARALSIPRYELFSAEQKFIKKREQQMSLLWSRTVSHIERLHRSTHCSTTTHLYHRTWFPSGLQPLLGFIRYLRLKKTGRKWLSGTLPKATAKADRRPPPTWLILIGTRTIAISASITSERLCDSAATIVKSIQNAQPGVAGSTNQITHE